MFFSVPSSVVIVRRCLQDNAQYLWTAASLQLMLPVVSGSTLQVVVSSSCHDTVAPSSVVGSFLLHARQPGTRCQIISVIRRSEKTLLGDR